MFEFLKFRSGLSGLGVRLRIAHVPHSRDALTRAKAAKVGKPRRGSGRRRGTRGGDFEWLIFPCVCGKRLGVISCECEIYFMKSGIDRHEVRSESEIVVFLGFGESSE